MKINDIISDKIDKIAEDLYDDDIRLNIDQSFFRSVLKSLFRSAVVQGIEIGEEEIALEIDKTIRQYRNPNVSIIEYRK